MAHRLLLKNGTVVDPSQNLMARRDVLVERDEGRGTRVNLRLLALVRYLLLKPLSK